ncbi:flavodoxin FldB [Thorsellia anophelis]|uniref:Flavodoxin n=1 Tax=Thorsellia anophelis DSM 18579 TaxID=1123402 RepID=A0A1H9ZQM4_9GAMM|nr:flavodoxin FldB [Thorsellia anophelis]SES83122.1 flavodoxin II [Thorsellia anophelis DSM 18579]
MKTLLPNEDLKFAIFFGSTTCYTEIVAEKIQDKLIELIKTSSSSSSFAIELYNIKDTPLSHINEFDVLILGISTWDFGELQEDWLIQWDNIKNLNLDNKTIALFGLGDQLGYSDWFLDAMGLLYQSIKNDSINWCGFWPTNGYTFTSTLPTTLDGKYFVGLALDEDSQYELTDNRIDLWCKQLINEWQTLNII